MKTIIQSSTQYFYLFILLIVFLSNNFSNVLGENFEISRKSFLSDLGNLTNSTKTILSRRKRFVAFPKSAGLALVQGIGFGIVGKPTLSYLSTGMSFGVAYDLPNASWIINNGDLSGFNKQFKQKTLIKRRSRRALYGEIEMLLESQSDQIFNNSKTNLFESTIIESICCRHIKGTNEVENESDCENHLSSKSSSPFLDVVGQSAPSQPPTLTLSGIGSKLNPILSRGKRYIAFPEGSSFSVAVCATIGIIGNPRFNYASYGLNWGTAYDLPNETWILNHLHGFATSNSIPAPVHKRRSRRELYREIERIVNNIGYDGKVCLLRALCESRRYFNGSSKMGMIGEMLKTVFSLPKQRLFKREIEENIGIEIYDHAYRNARSVDCAQEYPCTFSMLDLLSGRYSGLSNEYFVNQHIEDLPNEVK